MNNPVPRLIGAGELQRHASALLKRLAKSDQESFVVNRNEPQAVMMSLGRYRALKALEDLELISHRRTSPAKIRQSFQKTGLYSEAFLNDLEAGLKKSSLYSE